MAWMKPAGADVPSCCHGDAETINVKGGKQFSRNWTRETRTVRRNEWWEAEFCAELHILCVKKKLRLITMLHVEPFLFLLVSSCPPPWWKQMCAPEAAHRLWSIMRLCEASGFWLPLSRWKQRTNPQEETAASLRSVWEAASAEALPSRHK